MAEPVLVIHGVGNPRPEPFRSVVARLQSVVGSDHELIDVSGATWVPAGWVSRTPFPISARPATRRASSRVWAPSSPGYGTPARPIDVAAHSLLGGVIMFHAAEVYVLEDASGARTPPRDVEVRHVLDSGFFTHGSYWASEELAEAILVRR